MENDSKGDGEYDGLISFAVPCFNRAHDVAFTMPYLVRAGDASPPVEIVYLDYGSTDGLFSTVMSTPAPSRATNVLYRRYPGPGYFHKAHAFNLAILATIGDYFVLLGSDAYPHENYIRVVRQKIAQGCVWMRGPTLRGIIACKKSEFVDAGGYDERFEFYGPEDRDLEDRLIRRKGKFCQLPGGLMNVVPTSQEDKVKNFRINLSKREMSRLMHAIYIDNCHNNVMVANKGKDWGSWTKPPYGIT